MRSLRKTLVLAGVIAPLTLLGCGDSGSSDTAAQVQGTGPRCAGCAVGTVGSSSLPLRGLLLLWLPSEWPGWLSN